MKNTPNAIIPCRLSPDVRDRIERFAASLEEGAWNLGGHGLSREEFERSGLLRAAIERLRGRQAASMEEKRRFIAKTLDMMRASGAIASWHFSGGGDRHDYEIRLPEDRLCVIEAKGCLDGNNTNIFERPPHADEFYIWSLCQNPGADPAHNVWSGIHTRLGAEILHRRVQVDGLLVYDMLCGSAGRPCPKLAGGKGDPPPCVYLFPRRIADARHDPCPPPRAPDELAFVRALMQAFDFDAKELHQVCFEARYADNMLERRTSVSRNGCLQRQSRWTKLKRATR